MVITKTCYFTFAVHLKKLCIAAVVLKSYGSSTKRRVPQRYFN